MKISINKNTALKNIKKNYRKMIAVFISCLLIGIICGVYQKVTYKQKEPEPYRGESEVSIDNIEKDREYYFKAFDIIKREIDCMDLYFDYFQNVSLSLENKVELDCVKKIFNDYCEKYNEDEYYFWNTPLSAVDTRETAAYYQYRIDGLEKSRNSVEKVLEEENDVRELTDDEKQEYEAQLTIINIYIDKLNTLIDLLNNVSEQELYSNNIHGNELLEENVRELNGIIIDFNNVMKMIAESDDYIILYNKYKFTDQTVLFGLLRRSERETLLSQQKYNAIIYAKSREGLDIGAERMYAMITFFVLFGIILSLSFGVIYTPKERKKG